MSSSIRNIDELDLLAQKFMFQIYHLHFIISILVDKDLQSQSQMWLHNQHH